MSNLAINGGSALYESLTEPWPNYYDEDFEYIKDVIKSRVWGGIPFPGKYTSMCIDFVKKSMKSKYVTMVTNGSDALVIALKSIGIFPGDEVITTGYTWIATAGAVIKCNAVPVFVDIDPKNCCINPNEIQKKITKKTRGIIVVHLANQVCDMDSIMKISKANGLFVIEDCAHAPYSEWKHKCVGTIGDIGTFSFEQSKIITCGEGGMVVTQMKELHKKICAYSNCGRQLGTEEKFYGNILGWNYRMTELQATILYGQFNHIEEWTNKLNKNVEYLFNEIRRRSLYVRPFITENKNITRRQCYCVLLYYSCEKISLDIFCKAVRCEGAELEDKWYLAMNDIPLFHITASEWPYISKKYGCNIDKSSFDLNVCRDFVKNHIIWLHYPSFAGSFTQIDSLVDCIVKVEKNINELA